MKEALKATEDGFDHAVEIAEGIVAAACLKWSGNHRAPSHMLAGASIGTASSVYFT
jgi:hypothetical protein